MTSQVWMHGVESITVAQGEDNIIVLTITGEDGIEIRANCGRFHHDAENLREMLNTAHDAAVMIDRNWEDLPDEDDGYVFFDRGSYFVQLSGKRFGNEKGYPSRDIATYHLAEAMSEAGNFPNVWIEGIDNGAIAIDDDVRKFHDEGGTNLLPLEGKRFDDDAEVMADGWRCYVVKDYGKLGVTYVLAGDDTIHFTEDNTTLTPVLTDSEE